MTAVAGVHALTRDVLEEQRDMVHQTLEGLAQTVEELGLFHEAASTRDPEAAAGIKQDIDAIHAAAAIVGRRDQLLEQLLENFPNVVGRDAGRPT